MTKYYIDADEWYPFYSLQTNLEPWLSPESSIELSDEEYAQWEAVYELVRQWQARFKEAA